MTEFKPRIIKNDEDYELAMARLTELMDLNPQDNTPDSDELELLALLIEHYESVHYPIEKPSPIDAVLFRMDQAGLTRKDMEKYLGSASKVSEVLSGKRKLSMTMIQKLHYGLDIALNALIQKPDDIEWKDENVLPVALILDDHKEYRRRDATVVKEPHSTLNPFRKEWNTERQFTDMEEINLKEPEYALAS
ncbi:transcriptional regulator [Xenorhabdus sp. XENO-1]|uniref:helix-turn-helix domain-containing protein n=1 Tax=Xenorhabdus bovienii TaxID=40576 RepID=UPI0020CA34D1|nr:transcriptional regulator [Xenorhabdus bovienii]MCP9269856.1 transcriptional regulator [Xenorhabdus bovienii subsp. africana]